MSRLLTIAALLATAACTPEQHATGEHVLAALGVAPLPAALQDAPAAPAAASSSAVIEHLVDTAQVVEEPAPVVARVAAPDPGPPPPPPPNEYQVWQTNPTYVCVPVFRIKSCTDSGEPVWLDAQMGWLPFGVVP